MRKLAIIGAGRMACIYCLNAKEMNVETHCFAWEKGAYAKEYADFFYDISIFDKEKILSICKDIGIDGVIATTELTISITAYIAQEMKLIGLPYNIALSITDKYRNRELTKKIDGLNHPKYVLVHNLTEALNCQLNYPIILKPTSMGGKRGIQVVNSKEEMQDAFQYSITETDGKGAYIIEEYIAGGMEYSVESLSYKNKHYVIQITEKISSGPPHCVELGHIQPARLSKEIYNTISSILPKAYEAIGLINGASHTEIKIKDGKVYLIEFNSRPGGDHIAYPLTTLSTGFSYIKAAISIALNSFDGVNKCSFEHNVAGVFFVTNQTQYLKKVFDDCETKPWCYKKNIVNNTTQEIVHNDGYNLNYFIYYDTSKYPDFTKGENNG